MYSLSCQKTSIRVTHSAQWSLEIRLEGQEELFDYCCLKYSLKSHPHWTDSMLYWLSGFYGVSLFIVICEFLSKLFSTLHNWYLILSASVAYYNEAHTRAQARWRVTSVRSCQTSCAYPGPVDWVKRSQGSV